MNAKTGPVKPGPAAKTNAAQDDIAQQKPAQSGPKTASQQHLNLAPGALDGYTRVKGVMVNPHSSPAQVAKYLRTLGVIGSLEWAPASPQLLSLRFLQNVDGQLAFEKVSADQLTFTTGLTAADLAQKLAKTFRAEVRIGYEIVNYLPEQAMLTPGAEGYCNVGGPAAAHRSTRVVEISSLPATSVPFLAASAGGPVGYLPLQNGMSALLYSTDLSVWVDTLLCGSNVVALAVGEHEQEIFSVDAVGVPADEEITQPTDESHSTADEASPAGHADSEVAATASSASPKEQVSASAGPQWYRHSCIKTSLLLAGKQAEVAPEAVDALLKGLGHRESPQLTAKIGHCSQANVEKLFRMRGRESMVGLAEELGLPQSAVEFLYGQLPLEQVPDVQVFKPSSYLRAYERSVSMRDQEDKSLATRMHRTLTRNPKVLFGVNALQLAFGLTVIGTGFMQKKKGIANLLQLVGAYITVDSLLRSLAAIYVRKR